MHFPVFEPQNVTSRDVTSMNDGRARLVSVNTQNTPVLPRGAPSIEDYVTTSELDKCLTRMKEQHSAFGVTFARALGRMRKFQKRLLCAEHACNVCKRINLGGYECITCQYLVCELCFPVVMRTEARTTVVLLDNGDPLEMSPLQRFVQ